MIIIFIFIIKKERKKVVCSSWLQAAGVYIHILIKWVKPVDCPSQIKYTPEVRKLKIRVLGGYLFVLNSSILAFNQRDWNTNAENHGRIILSINLESSLLFSMQILLSSSLITIYMISINICHTIYIYIFN